MSIPLVSVLLPARNAGATLEACLRSVRRQRFTDWECLVVNDGSRDQTAALAAGMAARDQRIRVITTPARGLVCTLNEGLAACRGTFIARMDADDVMHGERLAAQSAALTSDASLVAVGSHVRMFPRQMLTAGWRAYETWLNSLESAEDVQRDAFVECPIVHPTLMARQEVIRAFGYREMPWAEDYDLVLRILEARMRIGIVARRLVGWRDGPTRLSRTDARYDLERFVTCKAHFLARGFLALHERFALWGYGDTGKALARALSVHDRHVSRIIEVHPGRIGQRIAGVPVVGLDALPEVRGQPLVVSVAGPRPRAEIRDYLDARGFVELRDYVCAA